MNNIMIDNQITAEKMDVALDLCTTPGQMMTYNDVMMFQMWVQKYISDIYFQGYFEFTTPETVETFTCIMETLSSM